MEYVSIQFNAGLSLNVDAAGEASPLDIRVYQISGVQDFNEADFFTLYNTPEQLLETQLLSQERLEIRPQQKVTFEISLVSKTEYIGIVCAYRHLNKSKWRDVIKLNTLSQQLVSVELTENGIKVLS